MKFHFSSAQKFSLPPVSEGKENTTPKGINLESTKFGFSSQKLTSPLNMVVSNRNVLFQGAPIFRCDLLVSGSVILSEDLKRIVTSQANPWVRFPQFSTKHGDSSCLKLSSSHWLTNGKGIIGGAGGRNLP